MNSQSRQFDPDTVPGEYNVVALWVNPRKQRLIAGALAGLFAGTLLLIFGILYCVFTGNEWLAPFKIPALYVMGGSAMAYGFGPAVFVGTVMHYIGSALIGMYYAHATGVNHKGALFGVGLTWAAFGWVFITNLFSPAFRAYFAAEIPQGVMFFAWIVFGLGLMSVAWFDPNAPKSPADFKKK